MAGINHFQSPRGAFYSERRPPELQTTATRQTSAALPFLISSNMPSFRPLQSVRRMPQTWNPDDYARTAGFVPQLGLPVLELLGPQPGELVLDLGCGDGALTSAIAACGARVIGIDTSPEMLDAARARGLDVRLADAAAFDLPERFDAVFSNAALHWVQNHEGVAAAVARHLRPDGRFVGELGGHGNITAIMTAILAVLGRRGVDGCRLNPWTYPTADGFRRLLERQGFTVDQIALIPRPTALPGDMASWLRTFGGAFLSAFEPMERESVIAEIQDLLAPGLRDPDGRWTADYVRLRFKARRSVAPTG
jgi:SAM-dependent methyltransferase